MSLFNNKNSNILISIHFWTQSLCTREGQHRNYDKRIIIVNTSINLITFQAITDSSKAKGQSITQMSLKKFYKSKTKQKKKGNHIY